VPAEAFSGFEVAGVVEGVLMPRLFSQGNVGLHPSKDTLTKMLSFDGHTTNVHHNALLVQHWL
jgi:hypothetical protein